MSNMVYQRYPLQMRHPSFRPAVMSDSDARTGEHGQAAMWPPVVVNNEDQEEYYISRGYTAPDHAGAREAFLTERSARRPNGFREREYPRWENGRLIPDPDAEIDDKTWPMWVKPPKGERRIVKDPTEYAAVMGHPYGEEAGEEPVAVASAPAGVDAAELAEFRAWKAAQAERRAKETADGERAELIAMADEFGIAIDKRWSTKRIKDTLEKATTAGDATAH